MLTKSHMRDSHVQLIQKLQQTIYELNGAIFDQVANEMPPDIDMFCLGMELPLWVCKCDGGLIIWVESEGIFKQLKDFTKKMLEPNEFLSSVYSSDVFCLSG